MITPPDPLPASWVSQTRRRRVAVLGELDGKPCTLLFVREESGGWLRYRYGLNSEAIRFSDADARKIADGLVSP
ncbi:MAG: hypothetical protein ACRDTC_28590 [Pseudonocardiaceae bacterium]